VSAYPETPRQHRSSTSAARGAHAVDLRPLGRAALSLALLAALYAIWLTVGLPAAPFTPSGLGGAGEQSIPLGPLTRAAHTPARSTEPATRRLPRTTGGPTAHPAARAAQPTGRTTPTAPINPPVVANAPTLSAPRTPSGHSDPPAAPSAPTPSATVRPDRSPTPPAGPTVSPPTLPPPQTPELPALPDPPPSPPSPELPSVPDLPPTPQVPSPALPPLPSTPTVPDPTDVVPTLGGITK
jgi:hypothetical protein